MSPSQGRYLHTGQGQTQIKSIQTSIPQVAFELTIPAFEREKTVHALDRAATVISHYLSHYPKIKILEEYYLLRCDAVGEMIFMH
jgi:hypothetical protein